MTLYLRQCKENRSNPFYCEDAFLSLCWMASFEEDQEIMQLTRNSVTQIKDNLCSEQAALVKTMHNLARIRIIPVARGQAGLTTGQCY